MGNVNIDYILQQAQANVNANKNNAQHQQQVQAQAQAAQKEQAKISAAAAKQNVLPLSQQVKQTSTQTTSALPSAQQTSALPYASTQTQDNPNILERAGYILDASGKKLVGNLGTLWDSIGTKIGTSMIERAKTAEEREAYMQSDAFKALPENEQRIYKAQAVVAATPIDKWYYEEMQKPENAYLREDEEEEQLPQKTTNGGVQQTSVLPSASTQKQSVKQMLDALMRNGDSTQKQQVRIASPTELAYQAAEEDIAKAKAGLGETGQTVVDIGSSLSDMALGMVTAGAAGLTSAMPVFVAQSAAEGIKEAKEDGATDDEALAYGMLKGGLTYVTEKLVGGIPMTGKALSKTIKPIDNAITKVTQAITKNPSGAALVRRTFDVLGEGAEEVLEEALTPFVQRMTYDGDAELATGEELLYSAVMGVLSAGIFNAPGAVSDVVGAVKSANAKKSALPSNTSANTTANTTVNTTPAADGGTLSGGETFSGEVLPRADAADMQSKTQKNPMQNASGSVKIASADVDTSVLSDFNTARTKFITYARKFFPSKVTINSNGKSVDITRNGLDKLLSGNIRNEKYISAFSTPQLIENGIKVGESQNLKDETKSGIFGYEYYDSPFTIDGKPYTAHIRVRNTTNGDKYYGHTVSEVDQIEIEPETRARETNVSPQSVNEVPDSISSIEQDAETVKTEAVTDYTKAGKVGDYLRSTINDEAKVLGKELGVPYLRRSDFAKEKLTDLANKYMQTGEFDAAEALSIFDEAWEEGKIINEDYYNEYKNLKDELRSTNLQMTDEIKRNIPDFTTWQKYNRFRVGMTESGGVPIDQKYGELSGEYPNLFPAEITDLSEQLMKMAEVSANIYQSEKSLAGIYGDQTGEQYKTMRKAFAERMLSMEEKLKQARSYQTEYDAKHQTAIPNTSPDAILKAYEDAKPLRRQYEKLLSAKDTLLTDEQKQMVERLAKGTITAEDVPGGIAKQRILELASLKKQIDDTLAPANAYKRQYKESLRNTAKNLIDGSYQWKDKSSGLAYSRETMERNVRDIVNDPAQAKNIIAEYFTPVHKSEAERTRFKNKMRDRVRAMDLNEAESYAVQFLGEKRAEIERMGQKEMKLQDFRAYNALRSEVNQFLVSNADKIDLPKVERAINEFHEIYDELFQQMNDARMKNGYDPVEYRKDYFPHFTETEPDSLLQKFGSAIGIEMDVKELPVDIAGRTHQFRPGIQWFGNTLRRTANVTDYDAVRGFDKYIEGVSNVIYHTDNIQKLRALSDEIRYEGTNDAVKAQIDSIKNDTTMSEYERDSRIKEIFEKQRTNLSKFVQEVEEYTNLLAGKKSRRDRNVESDVGRKIYSLAKTLENRVAANMVALNPGSWITNFAPLVQANANTGTDKLFRAAIDTVRSYAKDDGFRDQSTFLTNRRGSDPLVVNRWDKVSNMLTKPMEWIDNFTSDTIVRAKYYENIKNGMDNQTAMDEADAYAASLIADRSKGALPTLFESKNPVYKLFTQFQVEVNNQMSWMFKDLPREEQEAGTKQLAWKLMSLFIGSYLANDLYEKLKGDRVLVDPISMVNEAIGDVTGYHLPNVADAVGALAKGEAIPWGTEKVGVDQAISNFAEDAVSELPFVGSLLGGGRLPISSALPDASQLVKFADPEVSGKKKWNIAEKELLGKPLTYMALPVGGGQIKKTLEGLATVAAGGSYTLDNDGERKLQYPVYKENNASDILPYAQAAIFGKSSLPTAKEWVDSGFKTKSVKFTEAYDYLAEQGIKTKDAYELLENLTAIEKNDEQSATELKRAALLANNTLTPEQKTVIDRILIDSDKTTDYTSEAALRKSLATDSQKEKIAGYEKIGGTAEDYFRVYDAFKAAEGDSKLSTDQKKKNVYSALPYNYQKMVDETPKDENLNALESYLLQSMSGLTDEEKQYLDDALIGNDIMPIERNVTYGSDSEYALAAIGASWEKKYEEYADPAGIDEDTYVRAYYAYASATWEKGESGAKSKAVKSAIDSVTGNLSKAQKQVLYEAFDVGKSYW